MSYDMQIGEEDFNYTWNVAPMWYAAKPKLGIRSHYGMTGKQALKPLREIREYMEDNRRKLEKMNPPNGWGSYDRALDFVNRLIAASLRNPRSKWHGD